MAPKKRFGFAAFYEIDFSFYRSLFSGRNQKIQKLIKNVGCFIFYII